MVGFAGGSNWVSSDGVPLRMIRDIEGNAYWVRRIGLDLENVTRDSVLILKQAGYLITSFDVRTSTWKVVK